MILNISNKDCPLPRLNLKNLLLPLTALSLVVSTASAANELEARERVPTEELVEGIKSSDGRWFEVEMIIFEQSDHKDIRETFDQTVQNLTSRREWNLLEPVLKPDLTSWLKDLPHCLRQLDPMSAPEAISELSPRGFWAQFQNYQRSIATDWQIDDLYCLTANESLPEFWL